MWLDNVSTTGAKTITGCLMALGLTLYYCLASYAGRAIEPVVFGEMCAFAATIMGIAYAGFRTKRTTDYGYVAATGQAAAAASGAAPAPASGNDAPAPIVSTPAPRPSRTPRGR